MAKNPYLLDRPAVVSFSGGQTSGRMLFEIREAFGGTMPHDVLTIFNNTGKERKETLDFVERCSQEWGIEIIWLEYDQSPRTTERKKTRNGRLEAPYMSTFRVVNYATASRNGEPLMKVIKARNMLPNVMVRFCTVECKIRTTQRYLKSLGWTHYGNAIGFRADEPARVAKLSTTNRHGKEEPVCPLFKACVTKQDIEAWWDRQPFKLNLRDHEGNCDLCFLKGAGKIKTIMRDNPELAGWWIEAEAEAVRRGNAHTSMEAFFRNDRPRYSKLLELAQRPGLFDTAEADMLSIACHCTD